MNDQTTNPDQPKSLSKMIAKLALWLNLVIGLGLVVVHAAQSDWHAPITMVPPWMWLVPAGILVVIARAALTRRLISLTLLVWLGFLFLFAEEASRNTR